MYVEDDTQNYDMLRDGSGEKFQQAQATDEQQDEYGDAEDGGFLLQIPEAGVPKRILKMIDRQKTIMKRREVQWEVNLLRRIGVPNVKASVRDGQWYVWKAANVMGPDSVPSVNEAADLCRKLEAVLFADPPLSECVPPSGEDDDAARAEQATRVLQDIQGENGLNSVIKARRAFSRATSFGSGFEVFWFDPKGGGMRPMKIQAGFDPKTQRKAETVKDAVYDPQFAGQKIEWPDYQSRYVRKDGTLTDKEGEAARRWVGKLKSRVVTGRNIRFLPHDCEDIWSARAAIIVDFVSLREAIEYAPDFFEKLKKENPAAVYRERLKKMCAFRPEWAKNVLRAGQRVRDLDEGDATSRIDMEALVLRCELYYEQCPSYPKGAHIITFGETECALRTSWIAEVNGKAEPRLIPITQYSQLEEGRDDPYKVGFMEILGPGNELHQAAWAALLDVFDKTMNRKTFIPTTSPVHPKHMQSSALRYYPIMPGAEPKTEDQPEFPQVIPQLLERVSAQLQKASNMNETAQGLEASTVNSGRQASVIVGQVHAQLSELAQNVVRAWTRGGRIALQYVRADYTIEQQLRWQGDDGDYVLEAWRGTDFGDTSDVRLQPGSLSMLSQAQKEQQASSYAQQGFLQPHELRQIVRSNQGAKIGLQDDPHYQRIKRQVTRWKDGPDEEQEAQYAQMMEEYQNQVMQMQAEHEQIQAMQPPVIVGPGMVAPPAPQPFMPPPPPVFPYLESLFMPTPADVMPEVAPMRLYEIGRVMASKVYTQKPDWWRAALDAEFARMNMIVHPAPAPAMPGAPPAPVAEPAALAPVPAPQPPEMSVA